MVELSRRARGGSWCRGLTCRETGGVHEAGQQAPATRYEVWKEQQASIRSGEQHGSQSFILAFYRRQIAVISFQLLDGVLTRESAGVIIVPHRIIWSWYTGRWWVGCYIWYSEKGTEQGRIPPRPLLAVPNVTTHPSTASVPVTV